MKKLSAIRTLSRNREGGCIKRRMSEFIHNRAPYRTANHAKKESSRSNLLRMKENPTATSPTVIDAAEINNRGSSIRKVRNTSSALGCIFGYGNQWEKQTDGNDKTEDGDPAEIN